MTAPLRYRAAGADLQSVGEAQSVGAWAPGFITTASGRMAFVRYLSGYAVPPEGRSPAPRTRTLCRLYRDIYQNN